MKNIIDYAQNYTKTFQEEEFNEVDGLVLAQLCYLELESVKDKVDSKQLTIEKLYLLNSPEIFAIRAPELNKKLLSALAKNPRYKNIYVRYYEKIQDAEEEKQFSATTYEWQNSAYVAFRGTDSTIIGWKEDFNAMFQEIVPSQVEAVNYLVRHRSDLPEYFYVGGHSKGGNLAIFAAMYAPQEIQDRILIIFDNDGPGVRKENIDANCYKRIKNKIFTIIPEESFFGMVLYNDDNYLVVKSDGVWIYQHDPFNWHIHNNCFVYINDVSQSSKITRDTLNRWLYESDSEKRELLVNTVYSLISPTNIEKVSDMRNNFVKNAGSIYKAYRQLNKDDLEKINEVINEFKKFRQEVASNPTTLDEHKAKDINVLEKIFVKVSDPIKSMFNKLPIEGYKEMLSNYTFIKKAKKVTDKIGDSISDRLTKIGLYAIDKTEQRQKEVSGELAKMNKRAVLSKKLYKIKNFDKALTDTDTDIKDKKNTKNTDKQTVSLKQIKSNIEKSIDELYNINKSAGNDVEKLANPLLNALKQNIKMQKSKKKTEKITETNDTDSDNKS